MIINTDYIEGVDIQAVNFGLLNGKPVGEQDSIYFYMTKNTLSFNLEKPFVLHGSGCKEWGNTIDKLVEDYLAKKENAKKSDNK